MCKAGQTTEHVASNDLWWLTSHFPSGGMDRETSLACIWQHLEGAGLRTNHRIAKVPLSDEEVLEQRWRNERKEL